MLLIRQAACSKPVASGLGKLWFELCLLVFDLQILDPYLRVQVFNVLKYLTVTSENGQRNERPCQVPAAPFLSDQLSPPRTI